jgi:hypothetical protein
MDGVSCNGLLKKRLSRIEAAVVELSGLFSLLPRGEKPLSVMIPSSVPGPTAALLVFGVVLSFEDAGQGG